MKAFIFPGQGSQIIGMGKVFFDKYDHVKSLFKEADNILEIPLSIRIGAAYDGTNTITGTLASGDPYYVRVVNNKTVRIYNKENDALSGINTVGLATDTAASGLHVFRTITKNTITDIKVIEPGEGYQHRKLIVKPSGISTSFDTVNFVNHGFKNGELINYSPMVGIGSTMPREIQGPVSYTHLTLPTKA